ncbi:MAG: hypothetical protein IT367_19460 [Candidatus Hydrogenedentes bacterium]|nr:hypothetical protein [Candidatus Hydrogenedentota bacterium]
MIDAGKAISGGFDGKRGHFVENAQQPGLPDRGVGRIAIARNMSKPDPDHLLDNIIHYSSLGIGQGLELAFRSRIQVHVHGKIIPATADELNTAELRALLIFH